MTLNAKQIISIVGAVLSVLMISTAQLTDLFGAGTAKSIVSISGLVNLILQSIMTAITSQTQTVRDASQTKGVEVQVTEKASPAIAALAVDPANDSITAAKGSENAVADKSKEA